MVRKVPMSEGADARGTLTFVVRLWRESNASGQDHWRGRVEHVGSQQVGYVEDVAGVARFLARWTERDAGQPTVAGSPGRPSTG
jgi:hypothetical protein